MSDFSLLIREWYRQNKRELPWRNTKNPYFIWLSEIILQQTRVEQGKSYYEKFVKNYPTIEDLANAEEQEVLNDWQGLGYYSRARNLHATAKIVSTNFKNVFPDKYEEIIKLIGIGEYTAAAISSFAFDLPFSVVDGNVYRVLSRVFDIEIPIDSSEGKKQFAKLAQELLDKKNPAEHNQAIMEFGAIHCTPTKPNCENCPLQVKCLAFKNKITTQRPIKIGKTKVRKRFFNYLILTDQKYVFVQKRKEKDIWQHLFEFPLIESDSEVLDKQFYTNLNTITSEEISFSIASKKHILSHQHLFSQFHIIKIKDLNKIENSDVIKILWEEIGNYPLPRLIDRFLEENLSKIWI